jgi:multidrug transporter EmrE-like cation transporter
MALLVLAAALMHAGWNVMAKTAGDKLLNIGLISLGLGVVGLVFTPFVHFPDPASWHFLIGSLLAHLGYYVFLSTGYRHGDLSQVYPIARGAAPPLVALAAYLMIGETLSPLQMAGVLATSFGILSLAFDKPIDRAHSWRPIVFGLITSLTIMSYTLFDGQSVRVAGDHLGYIVWLFVLDVPLVIGWCIWRRTGAVAYFKQRWRFGLIGGVLSGGDHGDVARWIGQCLGPARNQRHLCRGDEFAVPEGTLPPPALCLGGAGGDGRRPVALINQDDGPTAVDNKCRLPSVINCRAEIVSYAGAAVLSR